jgi:hypothetical protein
LLDRKWNKAAKGPCASALIMMGLVLMSASAAHAQDDSVTARKYIGNKGVSFNKPNPAAKVVLREVPLGSSSPDFDVAFGPFKNDSSYTFTLILRHKSGRSARFANIVVDGVTAADSFNGEIAQAVISPKSTYSFGVRDAHLISVWVATDDQVIEADIGLPRKEDLETPRRAIGGYSGCVKAYNTITSPSGESENVPNGTAYYYEARGLSDRSNYGIGITYPPQLGGKAVVAGPVPTNPGTCYD